MSGEGNPWKHERKKFEKQGRVHVRDEPPSDPTTPSGEGLNKTTDERKGKKGS